MGSRDSLGAGVEFRAFRGAQRSATYRSCVVQARALALIVQTAAREQLRLVAQLPLDDPVELGRPDARQLASELRELRSRGLLLHLDADLVALAEVAHWCGRSRERAWLQINPH